MIFIPSRKVCASGIVCCICLYILYGPPMKQTLNPGIRTGRETQRTNNIKSPDVSDVKGYLPIGPDGIIIKENMSPTLMESALFYYMMMPQISCKEIRRLGKHGDGGWDICIDDNFFPNKKTCLVYSFGFRNNWSFDEDVAKIYNCEVHSFNPSLQMEDHKHSHNVWFHNLGVAGTDYFLQRSGWKMQSIPTIMKTLNHTSRNLDILKLDVEGAEWEIIPNMLGTGLFNHVKQFCFELHLLGKHRRTRQGLYQVYLLLKSIYDSGFRLYYSHINRATSYTSPLTKTMRHACIEFYFVNTRHADFIAASPE